MGTRPIRATCRSAGTRTVHPRQPHEEGSVCFSSRSEGHTGSESREGGTSSVLLEQGKQLGYTGKRGVEEGPR